MGGVNLLPTIQYICTFKAKNQPLNHIFINTIILNAFPVLRNILFVTEKIYDAYNFLKQKIQ